MKTRLPKSRQVRQARSEQRRQARLLARSDMDIGERLVKREEKLARRVAAARKAGLLP
jgi:hypothetical protein